MTSSNLLKYLAVGIILVLPFSFTKGKKPKKKAKQRVETTLTYDEQRRFDIIFHEAKKQQLAGNIAESFDLFSYANEINPNSAAALFEMAQYYSYLRDAQRAEECLKRAVELAPENLWYNQTLAAFYQGQNRQDDAIRIIEQMTQQSKSKSELLMQLVTLYNQKGDYEKVISTLNTLEEIEGKSEQISMQKYRIYSRMNDQKKAFAEMENLANEYPNDLRYMVQLGDLYLDNGQIEQAQKIYDEVESKEPDNVFLMLSKANYYKTVDNDSLYQEQLYKVITNSNLESRTRLEVMRSLVFRAISDNNDSTKVYSLFKRALALPQENNDMAELCVRYMVTTKMPVDSVKPVLRQMLDKDPENDMARNQLLSYAIEENNTDAVANVCKSAVEYSSSNPVYYFYLAVARYQQGKEKEALDIVTKGLDYTNNASSIDLVTRMFSLSGDLCHKLGDDNKAFQYYDSCLVYSPDDPLALNNYAYYLSLKNINLDKAENMSAKSLEKEPDNVTYIDTYAWIHFCQKKYAEAKDDIDKALNLITDSTGIDSPDNSTILEHAGDIYFMSGDKDGAMKLWKRALEVDKGNATLRKKIQHKNIKAGK